MTSINFSRTFLRSVLSFLAPAQTTTCFTWVRETKRVEGEERRRGEIKYFSCELGSKHDFSFLSMCFTSFSVGVSSLFICTNINIIQKVTSDIEVSSTYIIIKLYSPTKNLVGKPYQPINCIQGKDKFWKALSWMLPRQHAFEVTVEVLVPRIKNYWPVHNL